MYLRFPTIHQFSFWFGFILAILLCWIIARIRPILIKARDNRLHPSVNEKVKSRSTQALEKRLMQETLKYAQGMHLAAAIFRLDDILQEPRFLPPPMRIDPGSTVRMEDIVESTLPYLPAWPNLASLYKIPTLSLPDSLKGDSDLAILGEPGMGKSVALASMASCIARRDPAYSFLEAYFPVILHCADLDFPVTKDSPLNSIIEILTGRVPNSDKPKIHDYITKSFNDGRVVLFLDGVDELTGEYLANAISFIELIKKLQPKTRIVTTASFGQQWEFNLLNFSLLPIAAWSPLQREQFINTWGRLWAKSVSVDSRDEFQSSTPDSLLLSGWLSTENRTLTPFELTLKIWGACSGDLLGSRSVDSLESHIRRMIPSGVPPLCLEQLASAIHLAEKPVIDLHSDQEWLESFEFSDNITRTNIEPATDDFLEVDNPLREVISTPVQELITQLVDSGLFTQHRDNHIRYSHPIFGGYLAGKDFLNIQPVNFPEISPWIGKIIAFHYFASLGDASFLVEKYLSTPDRPMMQNLMILGKWLRDAPKQSDWWGKVTTRMVELIQQGNFPLGLRGQALTALIDHGGESSIASLLRQWLEANDPDLLFLASIGTGALRDLKSVDLLAELTGHANPRVRRSSCLALALIGSQSALDILADILLHGDDNQRRIAAEAMSNNPGEGYAMLKEGAIMKEDVMVRRACAFGLGRISESWAEKLLLSLQKEDDQWAVRNAASEVLEERAQPNPHIPNRLPLATDSPWLISFAGKKGVGISPEETPIELLLSVFKTGSLDEKIASLDYLKSLPTESVLAEMINSMFSGENELREAVFISLSEMATSGIQIPDLAN